MMAIHTNSTNAETSPAAGSNQHCVGEVDSDDQLNPQFVMDVDYSDDHLNPQFVKDLLNRCCEDEELLELLHSYFDNRRITTAFKDCLHQYLNTYRPIIQDKDHETPLNISHNHNHFFHDLSYVFSQQLDMLEILQSFHNSIAQELYYAKLLIKIFTVVFQITPVTVLVLKAAAAAAAVSVPLLVFIAAVGAWPLSCLKKYKNRLKKDHGVSGVMIVGARINISDLSKLRSSARLFEFQMKLMSENVDSGDAGEMRKKLAARFEELEGHADAFSRGIQFATQLTLPSLCEYLQN